VDPRVRETYKKMITVRNTNLSPGHEHFQQFFKPHRELIAGRVQRVINSWHRMDDDVMMVYTCALSHRPRNKYTDDKMAKSTLDRLIWRAKRERW